MTRRVNGDRSRTCDFHIGNRRDVRPGRFILFSPFVAGVEQRGFEPLAS